MGSIRKAIIWAAFFSTCASTTDAHSPRALETRIVVENKSTVSVKCKHPKWLILCNQLAPVTTVLCSLAPLPTFSEISRTKTVGSLPLLPYSSMTANGFIWALYGWITDSASVKWGNSIGMLMGTYYFNQFKKYSPPGSTDLPGTMTHHILALAWILLANAFTLKKNARQIAAEIIGKEATLIYIMLFASPLAALKNVLATKSADSIPLPFTIASTISCSLWSLVGLLMMNDFYIYFPSMMGLCCALAQLFLKGIYGSNVESATIQDMNEMHIHGV